VSVVKERSSSSVKLTGCAFLGMLSEYRRHARSYNNFSYRALDAEQFLNQARAYKEGLDQNMSDRLYRFIVNMRATHPFAVERARMLDEWVCSAEYSSILAGHYSNGNGNMVKVSLCPNPQCAQPTPPGNMFCGECGTPLCVH
jgi:hypothetical protein